MSKLPPPDPHESVELMPTGGRPVMAPTAVFVNGPVTPQTDQVADRLLDLRPGVLFVVSE